MTSGQSPPSVGFLLQVQPEGKNGGRGRWLRGVLPDLVEEDELEWKEKMDLVFGW